MEFARVAALRGHSVTLWEREARMGGQLGQAAAPPHKDRIEALAEYLQTQLKKLGVKVELAKEATAPMIEEFGPEALVLATGARPLVPDIPGLHRARMAHAGDVLEGKVDVGPRVAVIGGELVGCETAEFLADKGKRATVMRRGQEMASSVGPSLRAFFLERLERKGVTLLTGVKYEEATPKGLVITTKEGERRTITASAIVLAAGAAPDRKLYDEVRGKLPEVHLVGDCVEPRKIGDAIAEGYRAALEI